MSERLSRRQWSVMAVLVLVSMLACGLIYDQLSQRKEEEARRAFVFEMSPYTTALMYSFNSLQQRVFSLFDLVIFEQDRITLNPAVNAAQVCNFIGTASEPGWQALELVVPPQRVSCGVREQGFSRGVADARDRAALARLQHLPVDKGPYAGEGMVSGPRPDGTVPVEWLFPLSSNGRVHAFVRARIDMEALVRATGIAGRHDISRALLLKTRDYPDGIIVAGAAPDGGAPRAWQDESRWVSSNVGIKTIQQEPRQFVLQLYAPLAPRVTLTANDGLVLGVFAVSLTAVVLLAWRVFVARQRLARSVAARTGHVRRRMRALTQQRDEARLLEAALVETSDNERSKLGRELHDNTGQLLTAARMLADHLAVSATDRQRGVAEQLSTVLGDALDSVRTSARRMAPEVALERGLKPALERLVAQGTSSGIRMQVVGSEPGVDAESRLHLYRIAQEAVSNALRHGAANRIAIELGEERDWLSIRDNGTGFDPETVESGVGLRSLRQRAGLIGARLSIGREGQETVVTVTREVG